MTQHNTNIAHFIRALISAKPGDKICYYLGDLAFDRWRETQEQTPQKNIANFAKGVLAEHNAGRCLLMQQKINLNQYRYLAVKTSHGFKHAERKSLPTSGRKLVVVRRERPAARPLRRAN